MCFMLSILISQKDRLMEILKSQFLTSLAASMLSLRRSASVPVTVEPPRLAAAFFFTIALDTEALGAART